MEINRGRLPYSVTGQADEVARRCCFLAGDGAAFMTGAVLDINGGALLQVNAGFHHETFPCLVDSAHRLLSPPATGKRCGAAAATGRTRFIFGLSNFNARHRATNFTLEELPQVIDYLHQRNVRGYVTCNTLIFSMNCPRSLVH